MPAIAQNNIRSLIKKVTDNIVHVMTTPIITLQPTLLQNPAANLLHTLLKAPNALVIK